MKLMIVDDNTEVRALIRVLIGGFATEIVECANGVGAAYQCAAFRPDLVTMDLNLPLLSGIEATRRILAAHPAARVIVISQFDGAEYRLAASHAGACRFFSKSNLTELPRFVEQQQFAPISKAHVQ